MMDAMRQTKVLAEYINLPLGRCSRALQQGPTFLHKSRPRISGFQVAIMNQPRPSLHIQAGNGLGCCHYTSMAGM